MTLTRKRVPAWSAPAEGDHGKGENRQATARDGGARGPSGPPALDTGQSTVHTARAEKLENLHETTNG